MNIWSNIWSRIIGPSQGAAPAPAAPAAGKQAAQSEQVTQQAIHIFQELNKKFGPPHFLKLANGNYYFYAINMQNGERIFAVENETAFLKRKENVSGKRSISYNLSSHTTWRDGQPAEGYDEADLRLLKAISEKQKEALLVPKEPKDEPPVVPAAPAAAASAAAPSAALPHRRLTELEKKRASHPGREFIAFQDIRADISFEALKEYVPIGTTKELVSLDLRYYLFRPDKDTIIVENESAKNRSADGAEMKSPEAMEAKPLPRTLSYNSATKTFQHNGKVVNMNGQVADMQADCILLMHLERAAIIDEFQTIQRTPVINIQQALSVLLKLRKIHDKKNSKAMDTLVETNSPTHWEIYRPESAQGTLELKHACQKMGYTAPGEYLQRVRYDGQTVHYYTSTIDGDCDRTRHPWLGSEPLVSSYPQSENALLKALKKLIKEAELPVPNSRPVFYDQDLEDAAKEERHPPAP